MTILGIRSGDGLLAYPFIRLSVPVYSSEPIVHFFLLVCESRLRYYGDFENGMLHGKGVLISPTGKKYSGDFVYNEKCGNGVMKYADGSYYAGRWFEDKVRLGISPSSVRFFCCLLVSFSRATLSPRSCTFSINY